MEEVQETLRAVEAAKVERKSVQMEEAEFVTRGAWKYPRAQSEGL